MSRLMTGPAAPGSSFVSKAACSCTSSSSSSRNRPWVTGGAGAEVEGEAVEEGAHDVVFADGAGSAAGGEPGCAVHVVSVLIC
jgi:hypothetical protein